jgi:uncharacterized protein
MPELGELIDRTPWADTHEHLVPEARRLQAEPYRWSKPQGIADWTIPTDWVALLSLYGIDDLVTAGMDPADARAIVEDEERSPIETWELAEPAIARARSTGYLRAVDLTTERLVGSRLSRSTVAEIDQRLRALRVPGYYESVLREAANVESVQVHALDADPFEPDPTGLLRHDLAITQLLTGRHDRLESQSGIAIGRIDDYLDLLEHAFQSLGPQAVAVKCDWAYARPLAAQPVDSPPRRAFERLRRGECDAGERRQVEDFLFARCMDLAAEHRLPVKLHLGYLAGTARPQFRWVFDHARAIVDIVQRHRRTQFVLMHIAWPEQERLLAVAKHHPNVFVDLCWAWILAPRSTQEFVARFLTTVPSNKLLCFGGDYVVVENIVGHAEIARRGLQAALETLVASDWLTPAQAASLVDPLMRANANQLFTALSPSRTP